MEKIDQNKLTDLLELVTVLAFFFLIFVIYAPVSIWAEEKEFEKEVALICRTFMILRCFMSN